jgi:hypothetical protein
MSLELAGPFKSAPGSANKLTQVPSRQRDSVAHIDRALCQTSSAEVIYYQLTDLLQLVSSLNFEERLV